MYMHCKELSDVAGWLAFLAQVKEQILSVLNFTALLIEHSYARHIYNSTEHLCTLLGSPDLDVVLVVLNLLYVFGKRSNFISRLPSQQRSTLNSFLEYLGEVSPDQFCVILVQCIIIYMYMYVYVLCMLVCYMYMCCMYMYYTLYMWYCRDQ